MTDSSLKTQIAIEIRTQNSEEIKRLQDVLRQIATSASDGGKQFDAIAEALEKLAQNGGDGIRHLQEQVRKLSDEASGGGDYFKAIATELEKLSLHGSDSIRQLQEQVRQLADGASGGGEQFETIARSLERLGQQSDAIEQVKRLSDAIDDSVTHLGEVKERSDAAQAALAGMLEQLDAADQGSEEMRQFAAQVSNAQIAVENAAQEVDEAEEELQQLREEFEAATSVMMASGAASTSYAQSQENLAKKVGEVAASLDAVKQMAADRDLLNVRAHKDVQKEIEAVRAAYERLAASGKLTSKEMAQAHMKMKEKVRELEASTNGWMESILKAKSALVGVAGSLAGLKAVLGKAVEFESAMADVAKVVEGTDEQLASLASRIKEMSNEMPIAASGLAQMAAAGGQMGVPIEKLETFVQLAAKMGTAFGMSAEQAGDAVAKLSNVFGLPIEQVENLGDAINVLGNTMAAKEADIVEVLKRIGGSAKQFGLSAEQAAALGASMLALGVRAEVAGTGINAILTKLQTASMQGKEFQNALQSMGVSAEQLARDIEANPQHALEQFLKTLSKLEGSARAETLTKLFGIEYQDDVARLIGSLETYEGALANIGDATKVAGAMQEEFNKKNETAEAKIKRLKNTIETLAINLGEAFLPILKGVVGVTGELASGISHLASKFPVLTGLAEFAAGALVSMKGLNVAFLATKTALASLAPVAAVAFGPIGATIAAVAAGASVLGFGLNKLREKTKEARQEQERLAFNARNVAERLDEISKSTGIAVRSEQELNAALKEGRIVFDQASQTFLSAAQAQENMARSAATSADSIKTLGEKARQGAGEIMTAFQQAAAGGEKLEKALKKLPKALDMKAGAEGVAAFALALDELAQKNELLEKGAKLTAAQVSEAWKQAIEGMNAGNIGVLIENLKEAERQGALTAEQLAAAFDGIAGAALDRLGANAAQALGKVSKEARKAIDDLDAVMNTMLLTGMEAEKAGRAMEAAFAAAIPKADSLAAIKELEQRLLAAKDAGLMSERAFSSMSAALDGMKEALDPVNQLEGALKKLGVEMTKTWGGMSSGAKDAIKSVKEVMGIIAKTGETGKKAGNTIKEAFMAALQKMDSLEALAAFKEELQKAYEAGKLTTGQMNELTAAISQQEAALHQNSEAVKSTVAYIENMTRIAEEAKAALNDAGGGEGWTRAASAARDYADAASEAGEASAQAAEASENAGHVSYGTWWDATIAASDYAEAASEAALRATGFAGKVALGAGAIADMNNQLREAAHSYITMMEGFDRQMQQIASSQSGAARGVEDLQMRLLQLNGSEEQIAEARAAREKMQLEREIKMLEIERSRAAFLGDSATVQQLDEELKLMGEQQKLLDKIHKEEARQRKEAAKEKERQEKEAKRREREEKKKAEEAAGNGSGGDTGASKSAGGGGSSGGGSSPQTKNSTINLGGITINGGGISDPAKFAKLLEPELKKLQRLSA